MTTATPHIYDAFGALRLPLEQKEGAAPVPLDPVRDELLALFAAAINAELADWWAAAMTGVGDGHILYGSCPVRDTLPLEPSLAVLQQRLCKFPLLSLHRFGKADDEPHTLYAERLKQTWQLSYMLGPLEVADLRRFGDACIFASKLVSRVIDRRGHPAYKNGELQFYGDQGSPSELGAIRKVSHEGPGQASFAGDAKGTLYYAVTITLETLEYSAELEDGESVPFGGVDYDLGVGGAPEGVIRGLVYASTDPTFQPQ